MSNKKKQNHEEVFMNIEDRLTKETYLLKVPYAFRFIMQDLMDPEKEIHDYHNSNDMLMYFCELFCAASDKKRNTFEIVINSPALKVKCITDLITIFLELHKYYVLRISTYEELGRFHILAARRNEPESELAQADFKDARSVAKSIKQRENGCFVNGFYVGKYHYFLETDD